MKAKIILSIPIVALLILLSFIYSGAEPYFLAEKEGVIFQGPNKESETIGTFKKGDVFVFHLIETNPDWIKILSLEEYGKNQNSLDRRFIGFVLAVDGEIYIKDSPIEVLRTHLQKNYPDDLKNLPMDDVKSKIEENKKPFDGKTIHTGPRGGQYYYNSSGKKTYIKKK